MSYNPRNTGDTLEFSVKIHINWMLHNTKTVQLHIY